MKQEEEEANRIIEMFDYLDGQDGIFKGVFYHHSAKCAILHVEGIIENLQLLNHDPHFRDLFSYWQEVLEIIKNK